MKLSVIIPTRNPDANRLARTLESLAGQTLAKSDFEIILVDNGSDPALDLSQLATGNPNLRIVRESEAGLTPARLRGMDEARGAIFVFVDDDNVLNPAFLEGAIAAFDRLPNLGVAGGPVRPEFAGPPPPWLGEFFGLLALQDPGPSPIYLRGGSGLPWPSFAPVGAGLCLRRTAIVPELAKLRSNPLRKSLDRQGNALTSGGDNDLVFAAYHAGFDVGYFPDLVLTHLIPESRTSPEYLGRLNEGIQRSWVRVLALNGQRPWPQVARWTVPLRSARAWLRTQAWRSPERQIRWRGLRGRFMGQADLAALPVAD